MGVITRILGKAEQTDLPEVEGTRELRASDSPPGGHLAHPTPPVRPVGPCKCTCSILSSTLEVVLTPVLQMRKPAAVAGQGCAKARAPFQGPTLSPSSHPCPGPAAYDGGKAQSLLSEAICSKGLGLTTA